MIVFASAKAAPESPWGRRGPCQAGHEDAHSPRSFHFHSSASLSAMTFQLMSGRQVFLEAPLPTFLTFRRENKKSGEKERGNKIFNALFPSFPSAELLLRKNHQIEASAPGIVAE